MRPELPTVEGARALAIVGLAGSVRTESGWRDCGVRNDGLATPSSWHIRRAIDPLQSRDRALYRVPPESGQHRPAIKGTGRIRLERLDHHSRGRVGRNEKPVVIFLILTYAANKQHRYYSVPNSRLGEFKTWQQLGNQQRKRPRRAPLARPHPPERKKQLGKRSRVLNDWRCMCTAAPLLPLE
jgi:hypothetical protein